MLAAFDKNVDTWYTDFCTLLIIYCAENCDDMKLLFCLSIHLSNE